MNKEEMEIALIRLKKKKVDIIDYINENYEIFVSACEFSQAWNDTRYHTPKLKEIRSITEKLVSEWLNG